MTLRPFLYITGAILILGLITNSLQHVDANCVATPYDEYLCRGIDNLRLTNLKPYGLYSFNCNFQTTNITGYSLIKHNIPINDEMFYVYSLDGIEFIPYELVPTLCLINVRILIMTLAILTIIYQIDVLFEQRLYIFIYKLLLNDVIKLISSLLLIVILYNINIDNGLVYG